MNDSDIGTMKTLIAICIMFILIIGGLVYGISLL